MSQCRLQGRSQDRSQSHNKNKKGFTIIEVVLVLAIAGLIFLMVFIALPALQSSQRNTQRENDLDRILTSVTEYSTNNSGRLPFTLSAGSLTLDSKFVRRYIDSTCPDTNVDFTQPQGEDTCTDDQFRDPDGNNYHFKLIDGTGLATDDEVTQIESTFVDSDHAIYAVVGVSCGTSEGTVTAGTGTRQVALYMVMEGGGVACVANK